MRQLSTLSLVCFCFLLFRTCDAPAATARQEQLKKQYEDALTKLKDDDEAGYQRLALWCQQNKLTKEADQTWNLLLTKKRDKLTKNPSLQGYQALISWCTTAGLKQPAEDLKHEMLVYDYGQRKAKLKLDDAKGVQALLQWCQQNKLTTEADSLKRDMLVADYGQRKAKVKPDDAKEMQALAQWCEQNDLKPEALECWRAVLVLQPDNADARMACWAVAPTGLLKKQKVPGYTQDTAWYHVSVPKEHKETKTGLTLIIFLHGGQHDAGTADNVVAMAQVVPAFKKNIVVFPNHLKTWWAHPRELTYLLETLDNVMLRWHVDPKRIYLMGASMGGNGTWAVGCRCTELFAGLAPFSGFYAEFLEFPMKNLVSKPIYVVHGTKDGTVPIDGARKAFELLKKEGANIEMHEVDCGHQIPMEEFGKAADWLLQYSNKQDFDLKAVKERIAKLPVPGWLKQYPGN